LQVSLRQMHRHFCGGTLINSWTVLTAASCVHEGAGGDFKFKKFAVALGWQKSYGGRKHITGKNSKFGQQIIKINLREGKNKGRVFVHPDYHPKNFDTMYPNDIAIIILSGEVK